MQRQLFALLKYALKLHDYSGGSLHMISRRRYPPLEHTFRHFSGLVEVSVDHSCIPIAAMPETGFLVSRCAFEASKVCKLYEKT